MGQDLDALCNERIAAYLEAINSLKTGNYKSSSLQSLLNNGDQLGAVLCSLANKLEKQALETRKLNQITTNINAGLLLEEILELVYQDFREVIPYNRIGFALVEEDGNVVRAHWAKSDQPIIRLPIDYKASLAGSSLEAIILSGQPRVLNDLEWYLENKPDSASTRLIVEEGMRSSLTCPLVANNVPVGFMFFSSKEKGTYADAHVDTFKQIAGQLSIILEKGRMVSELTAQKEEIEEKNEELYRLDELKNTFLGIAAHDLRGPIGNIQMIASLLVNNTIQLAEKEREALLHDTVDHTQHILDLLDELLDVTRIESGKLELKKEAIDLQCFLGEAVERHTMMAAPKKTQIALNAKSAGIIQADTGRLRQVIDNLLSNAIKFSPPGSSVSLGVQKYPTGWRFSVKDQGPGVTEVDRDHLFQDFAKLSARPTGGEKSTGLGLAITRRIVQAHGGTIGVDSKPGQGANFWFILPDKDGNQ